MHAYMFMPLTGSWVNTLGININMRHDTSIKDNRGRLFQSCSNIGRQAQPCPKKKKKKKNIRTCKQELYQHYKIAGILTS